MSSELGLVEFLKEGRVRYGAHLGRYVVGGVAGPGEGCQLGRTKVEVGSAVGGRHRGIWMFLMMRWERLLERMI